MAIDELKLKEDVKKYFAKIKAHNVHELVELFFDDIIDIIDEQPKISFENKTSDKWIPCSERLPKKEGWYYVTLESRFNGHRCTDGVSYYHGWSYASGDVVAWKEHSEPYKGE